MKRINRLGGMLAAVIGLVLGACSTDGDKGETPTPVFPDVQTLQIEAGEELEVSFEANMDWILTSDKQWLKFKDEIGDTQSLLGKAGSQSVVLKVSDANMGFEETEAEVSLSMGGSQAVIFKVVRPGAERQIHMYMREAAGDAPATETPSIEIGYGKNIYVGFSGNFDWRVLSAPEWIAVNDTRDIRELTGKAGEEHLDRSDMAILSVDLSSSCMDNSGEIVIGAQAEGVDFTQSFVVTSEGIAPGTIEWSQTNLVRNEGFIFTQSGLWHKNMGLNTYEDVDDPAEWSVRVRDYKYDVRILVWNGSEPEEIEPSEAWVNVTDDGRGNLTCRPGANTDADRELGLFIVPEGVEVDYANYFDDNGKYVGGWIDESSGEFVRGEYAIRISQEGVEKSDFMLWKYSTELAPAQKASDENQALVKACGIETTNIYERAFTAEEWSYDPAEAGYKQLIRLGFDNPQFNGNVAFFDETGRSLTLGSFDDWGTISLSQYSGMLTVGFNGESRIYDSVKDRKLIVVFKDSNDAVLGAFLILMQQ